MTEKVKSREDVQEINWSKRRCVELAAAWERAIRAGQKSEAMRIRHESNNIKREIRLKYDIII